MTPEEINSFSRDYSRVSDTNDILWIKFEYANYEFYSWRIFLIAWCNPKKIMSNLMQKKQVKAQSELKLKSDVHSTPAVKSVSSYLSQTIKSNEAKGQNIQRIKMLNTDKNQTHQQKRFMWKSISVLIAFPRSSSRYFQ